MKNEDAIEDFKDAYGDDCADEMEEYIESYPFCSTN